MVCRVGDEIDVIEIAPQPAAFGSMQITKTWLECACEMEPRQIMKLLKLNYERRDLKSSKMEFKK